MKKPEAKFQIGIDEVGRGPLAGPVAVGVAMATQLTLRRWRAIKESKQLTRAQREAWYAKIIAPKSGVTFAVSFVSASSIDKEGINHSIKKALMRALKKLDANPSQVRVLLDGGLRAPPKYKDQTTIIRGDAKEIIIAIASVVAKVTRDRYMHKQNKRYPAYGFDQHVGYGTKAHICAIRLYGLTPLHRKSFCKNFAQKKTRRVAGRVSDS